MIERTMLVAAGKKAMVPRLFKRVLQIATAVALTASVLLIVIVGGLVHRRAEKRRRRAW